MIDSVAVILRYFETPLSTGVDEPFAAGDDNWAPPRPAWLSTTRGGTRPAPPAPS